MPPKPQCSGQEESFTVKIVLRAIRLSLSFFAFFSSFCIPSLLYVLLLIVLLSFHFISLFVRFFILQSSHSDSISFFSSFLPPAISFQAFLFKLSSFSFFFSIMSYLCREKNVFFPLPLFDLSFFYSFFFDYAQFDCHVSSHFLNLFISMHSTMLYPLFSRYDKSRHLSPFFHPTILHPFIPPFNSSILHSLQHPFHLPPSQEVDLNWAGVW